MNQRKDEGEDECYQSCVLVESLVTLLPLLSSLSVFLFLILSFSCSSVKEREVEIE